MSAIFIYGPSGSGKSTSIEGLPAEQTAVICSDSKALPFQGWRNKYKTVMDGDRPDFSKSNYVETKNPHQVLSALKQFNARKDLKYVVWDTFTHMLIHQFMTRAKESGWDKFTDFAKDSYDILNYIQTMDKHVAVMGHDETSFDSKGSRIMKVRTIGKLLDEKIDIPSLFTIVLIPTVERDGEKADYFFMTQSDGANSAKSPKDMFPFKVKNNLKEVFDMIEKYES